MRQARILTIGDEILSGAVADSNAAYIAGSLTQAGFNIRGISSTGDDIAQILAELGRACADAELVVTTGGLGPTSDDLTRQALAQASETSLVLDAQALAKLEAHLKRRQAVLNENNLRQAHFPERALVIPNRSGSADAFLTEINKKDGKRVMVFSLPGVPLEMRVLMDEEIIPRCRALFGAQRPYHAEYLKCFGLGEAHIGGQIERCALDDAVNVAYRPRFPEILLTLTIRGRDEWPEARVRETLRQSAEKVKLALGRDYVFSSVPEESLAQVVGSLLVSNSATIACAESCSGGLLAHEFVSVPGASAFFVGSIVAYANRVKESCLGVKHETIQSFGAVSAETAAEMACAARTIMGSDFGVSVTGIAGPGGGTVDKPAGTVWCSVAHPKGVYTCRLRLSWGRDYVRRYSTFYALDLVRRFLLRLELPQAS